MTGYPHLAARIFDTPLLVHPQKLDAILAGLAPRLLGAAVQVSPSAVDPNGPAPAIFSTRRGERTERGWRIVDGVAVLPVSGVLVHRSRFVAADSAFLSGYNDLAADLEDALAHPDVHAILQVYDSPGGEVAGAFEYAQRIHAARGRKPLWAIADNLAASAAYLSASACDQVAVTQTGYCGSIGVVMRHVDVSRAMANDGITISHIFCGAHKVDGNPYEPLAAQVRESLQAEISELYALFVQAVARHRNLPEQAVRDTEARTYRAAKAVAQGLADRVSTCDALISELAALRARLYPAGPGITSQAPTQPVEKGATMHDSTQATGQQPATQATPAATQAAPCTPSATPSAAAEAATAQAVAAERERACAILSHEHAQGRHALALQCVALGLPVDQAAALLASSPRETAASQSQFDQVMQGLNPGISGIEGKAETHTAKTLLAQAFA